MGTLCDYTCFMIMILIVKPKEGVHRAGKPIVGVVKYAVAEPTELKDIVLSFAGKGKCSWTESQKTSSGYQSITYTGTDVYVSEHISIVDKREGKTFVLPVGTYEHPFNFLLPKDIPPSFKNKTCTIKYRIRLKFEKPNFFSLHKRFSAEVDVRGYVNPTASDGPIVFGLEKSLFKLFSKNKHSVKLKVQISKATLTPGESTELSFVVENDADVVIPTVNTDLICYTKYTANCGKKKRNTKLIKECTVKTPSIPVNAIANMSNVVSTLTNLYSIQHTRIMTKEYKLKVTLRLPLPHLNASVEMPVVIGETYPNEEVQVPEDEEDQPPTYWEAMCEDNDKDND